MKRFIPRPWQLRGLLAGTISQLRLPADFPLTEDGQHPSRESIVGPDSYLPSELRDYDVERGSKPVFGVWHRNGDWGVAAPLRPYEPRWIATGFRTTYDANFNIQWWTVDGFGACQTCDRSRRDGRHSGATMPYWLSQEIFREAGILKVDAVRVERVAETSEEDAVRCGSFIGRCPCREMQAKPRTPLDATFRQTWCHEHGPEFHEQWQSDYPGTYDGWCWVVEIAERSVR